MYNTEDEYTVAIAETQLAIARIKNVGKMSENESGGSRRKMEEAELRDLTEHLQNLQRELKELTGERGAIVLGVAW